MPLLQVVRNKCNEQTLCTGHIPVPSHWNNWIKHPLEETHPGLAVPPKAATFFPSLCCQSVTALCLQASVQQCAEIEFLQVVLHRYGRFPKVNFRNCWRTYLCAGCPSCHPTISFKLQHFGICQKTQPAVNHVFISICAYYVHDITKTIWTVNFHQLQVTAVQNLH